MIASSPNVTGKTMFQTVASYCGNRKPRTCSQIGEAVDHQPDAQNGGKKARPVHQEAEGVPCCNLESFCSFSYASSLRCPCTRKRLFRSKREALPDSAADSFRPSDNLPTRLRTTGGSKQEADS